MERYNAESERKANVVGKRIAEARSAKKLSLSAFAELLTEYGVAVGRSAVYKWETGVTIPSAYQLLAVCQALDIEDELPYFMSCCKRAGLNMEGQEKLREYRELLASSECFRRVEEIADVPYIEMPVSRLAASAGTGSFLDEGSFEMERVPRLGGAGGRGVWRARVRRQHGTGLSRRTNRLGFALQ